MYRQQQAKNVITAMGANAKIRFVTAAVSLAALLSGCTGRGETASDKIGGLLVSPGRYEFYDCTQLASALTGNLVRERQIEELIVKAGPGFGGQITSIAAYRPEQMQVRGHVNEIRKAAIVKNCNVAAAAQKPAAPEKPTVPPSGKPKQ